MAIKADIKSRIPQIDKDALVIIDETCKQTLTELSTGGIPAKLNRLVAKYFSGVGSPSNDDGE